MLLITVLATASVDSLSPYRSCHETMAIAGGGWASVEIRSDLSHRDAQTHLTFVSGSAKLVWEVDADRGPETARPLELKFTQRLARSTRFPVQTSILLDGREVWTRAYGQPSLSIIDLTDPAFADNREPGWALRASYPGVEAELTRSGAPNLIGSRSAHVVTIDATGTESIMPIHLPNWTAFLDRTRQVLVGLSARHARRECEMVETIIAH